MKVQSMKLVRKSLGRKVIIDEEKSMTNFMAEVNIHGKNISGYLMFLEDVSNAGAHVNGFVNGLTDGKHGIHIHESGDLNKDCHNVGSHFNIKHGTTHGAPGDLNKHTGDLGNITSLNGEARFDIFVRGLHIGQQSGPTSILNRALIIHSSEDDLGMYNTTESKTTGNSGTKIACGLISPM